MISTAEIRAGFTRRLVQLCQTQRSVSYICQETGINRQQFAKYLSGVSVPSLENTFKIAEFFDVSVDEILTGNLTGLSSRQERRSQFSDYANRIFASIEIVENTFNNHRFPVSGYYHSYNNSFCDTNSDDLYILVSLVRLSRENGTVFYDRRHYPTCGTEVENMRARYCGTGFVNMKNMYIRYADCTNKDGFGMVLLRQVGYLSNNLNGLQAVAAATREFEPAASRIYYRYLGQKPDLRAAIRACGVFKLKELEEQQQIVDWVTQPMPTDKLVLRAL